MQHIMFTRYNRQTGKTASGDKSKGISPAGNQIRQLCANVYIHNDSVYYKKVSAIAISVRPFGQPILGKVLAQPVSSKRKNAHAEFCTFIRFETSETSLAAVVSLVQSRLVVKNWLTRLQAT